MMKANPRTYLGLAMNMKLGITPWVAMETLELTRLYRWQRSKFYEQVGSLFRLRYLDFTASDCITASAHVRDQHSRILHPSGIYKESFITALK